MATLSSTPSNNFMEDDPCGLIHERNSTPVEQSLDPYVIKEQVNNYQTAFENSGVPNEYIIQAIPINIKRIKELIEKNDGDDLAGMRLYFSKKSADPKVNDDYQLTLVPCTF